MRPMWILQVVSSLWFSIGIDKSQNLRASVHHVCLNKIRLLQNLWLAHRCIFSEASSTMHRPIYYCLHIPQMLTGECFERRQCTSDLLRKTSTTRCLPYITCRNPLCPMFSSFFSSIPYRFLFLCFTRWSCKFLVLLVVCDQSLIGQSCGWF